MLEDDEPLELLALEVSYFFGGASLLEVSSEG